MSFALAILAVFGLAAGSFINTSSIRLLEREAISGRSRCRACSHTLSWYDLIPVFSFLMQRGRCRYCSSRISLRYLLGEIATALIFVIIGWRFFSFPEVWFSFKNGSFEVRDLVLALELILWLFYASILLVFFETDLEAKLLPDRLMYPALLFVLPISLFFSSSSVHKEGFHWLGSFAMIAGALSVSWWGWLVSSGLVAFLFFLISFVSQGRWMGWGDGKLVALLGMMFGFPELPFLLVLGFLLGGTVALALILARRASRSSEIPLGPFLISGAFLTIAFGQDILHWYFGLFPL